MRVLLDTNILLLHLAHSILTDVAPDVEFYISSISVAEAFRYPGLGDDAARALMDIITIMTPLSIDMSIALRASELGRTRKTRLPDLLIAATALHYGLILITKDLKDFKNIPGLIVRDSF